MKWSYGITTVPSRLATTLPQTIASLAKAGFDNPRLFVDGIQDYREYVHLFSLPITTRWSEPRDTPPKAKELGNRMGAFGNWALALGELYLREPHADRYALFQDDVIASGNLRKYLEHCTYPAKGYWNLYTFPTNQELAPAGYLGWYLSNQNGKGALGLVFNGECVGQLLSHAVFIQHAKDYESVHAYKWVDGAVVTSLVRAGYKEYVHTPSPLQHIGEVSTVGMHKHPLADSFRSEDFDLMSLATFANTPIPVTNRTTPVYNRAVLRSQVLDSGTKARGKLSEMGFTYSEQQWVAEYVNRFGDCSKVTTNGVDHDRIRAAMTMPEVALWVQSEIAYQRSKGARV